MKRMLAIATAMLLALSCACAGLAQEESLYPYSSSDTLTILMTADSNVQNAGYAGQGETELWQYLQEQTGISVEIQAAADGAALLLALASGEYPDVVMMYESTYTGGLSAIIEDELAVNLLDYADAMPDYYALLESRDDYMRYVTHSDGGIYFFATLIEEGNITSYWRGMVVRQDFLDQLKMDVPTTNEAFYEMLVAFRDQLGCDIPLCCNWWANMLGDGFMTTEYGLVSADKYQKDGVFHYGAYEPEYKDALAYMNMLYEEGLFDVNFQTTDEATSQASLLNGETGAHFTSVARINTISNRATDENFELVGIASLNASDGTNAYFTQTDTLTPTRVNAYITADCDDPRAAVAFFNWLYTDEGTLTANYGKRDLCWTDVDGSPKFTEYMTNNENGLSLDNMLYVQTMVNQPGLYLGDTSKQRFAMPSQVAATETWRQADSTTYLLPSYTITDPELNTEATTLWTDLNTYISECRAKFISGQMSLEDDFETYLSTLAAMGMDRWMEIQQTALDAYYAK